ncbi:MAG: recombinase family protein [Acidithiobacillus sp.]|jgi:DNA invertase Pin-like site-specific DNA recombinase|uniref:recombinase family protein n=1 Tax=Acidithiobacillus sp. TaxID=1872118 RepID=UPI00355FF877
MENTEKIIKKSLFAYYRISPNPRKNSPEMNQKKKVREYCTTNPYTIVKEFQDLLISGKDMNRPQFQLMISELPSVDGIIIYDVSRFARNSKDGIPIFLNILSQGKCIVLVKNNKMLDYSKGSDMSSWEMLVPIIEMFQAEEYLTELHKRELIGIERLIEKRGGKIVVENGIRKVIGAKWGASITWGYDPNTKKQLTKEQFIKKYNEFIEKKISKRGISRMLDMDINTIYKRLKELKLSSEIVKDDKK